MSDKVSGFVICIMKRPCLNLPDGSRVTLGIGLIISLALAFFVTLTIYQWLPHWLHGPFILSSVFIQAALIIVILGILGIIK